MAWSEAQIEILYDNVYHGRLECPACGGRLDFAPGREIGLTGVVACGGCDVRHAVGVANDPLRSRFREYTETEVRAIHAAERAGATPTCPVDGAEMIVHLQRSLGRTSNAMIRCRRCARVAQYVRTHG